MRIKQESHHRIPMQRNANVPNEGKFSHSAKMAGSHAITALRLGSSDFYGLLPLFTFEHMYIVKIKLYNTLFDSLAMFRTS